METLLSWTALPNLHPALIHFPIALAAVALFFDGLQFVAPTRARFERSAALLWALAAVGAAVTYWAGQQAADGLGVLPEETEGALAAHADAAWTTLIAICVLAALRLALWWRDRNAATPRPDSARMVILVAALALQGLLARTADLGGALVYRHGVAVATHADLHHEDAAPVAAGGAAGIALDVAGKARIELSGTYPGARLEARLDTSEFDGSVTLAVEVDAENANLLRADSAGRVELVSRREGAERILAEGSAEWSNESWTLVLTTAGSHWKGFVDGVNVVHGHTRALAAAGAKLLLEGSGTVRIVSFRTNPVTKDGARARPDEGRGVGGVQG